MNKNSALAEASKVKAALDLLKSGKMLPEKPGIKPQAQKSEREWLIDEVKSVLRHEVYQWLQERVPACIDLLVCSQALTNKIIKERSMTLTLFPSFDIYLEYSFVVAPAAKAYEGILLEFMVLNEAVVRDSTVESMVVGRLYKDTRNKQAVAKGFVKPKNRGIIDGLYGVWQTSRNKVLHYDEDWVVNSEEAIELVRDIHNSIKRGYKVLVKDRKRS